MLHYETILPDTLELLKVLQSKPELQSLRLVGGTALALQYGHRQSVDLDFFGRFTASIDDILAVCRSVGQIQILNRTTSILQLLVNGIKADFVNYSCYEWIDKAVIEDSVILASPKDIAALKINAIEGRGTKKDFVDIFVLLHHYSLDDILCFYAKKYPEHSVFRALLSLTYFSDADIQPMPTLFLKDTWEDMKQYIDGAVKQYQAK